MLTVSTQLFDYKNKMFVADASDLGWDKTMREFFMRSAVTGALVHFTLVETATNEDGEVRYWAFDSEWLPSVEDHVSAMVFND